MREGAGVPALPVPLSPGLPNHFCARARGRPAPGCSTGRRGQVVLKAPESQEGLGLPTGRRAASWALGQVRCGHIDSDFSGDRLWDPALPGSPWWPKSSKLLQFGLEGLQNPAVMGRGAANLR